MEAQKKGRFMALACTLVVLVGMVTAQTATVKPGKWTIVIENGGVSAMHMTTTFRNTVVMFDRTNFGPSQIMLDRGRCRDNAQDQALTHDCWAHSIEYDIGNNSVRPLMVFTDTWCSSGAFAANGTLVQTGGWRDGAREIRYFGPCARGGLCDWDESQPDQLAANRWYASNQILPDGRMIVVGGTGVFNYEFVPKSKAGEGVFSLPFLSQTRTSAQVENNLYPFTHLSSDGNLFIFANRDAILFDYKNNVVVKTFPRIPDGPRNYPSTGSSVMLPLSASDNFQKVEVLVCGGAPDNGFASAKAGNFIDALKTCGRMVVTDANPSWAMENMPGPRTMSDMILLPTGEVLIINGATKGVAGWDMATSPILTPYLYRLGSAAGQRFTVLAASTVPRMYHSTANLLPNGKVLVGGSNPHFGYELTGVQFPTELRLETYSPYYLDSAYSALRPRSVGSPNAVRYGAIFTVKFTVSTRLTTSSTVAVNIYAPSFTTHSWSMNQRLLNLKVTTPVLVSGSSATYTTTVTAPPTAVAAPPGYYMLFVVNGGIPSTSARWVRFGP